MPPPSASPSLSRKSSKLSAVAIGTVTLQAAASIPKASSAQVFSCSANQDNMQQCTLLSTDNEFPWGTVMILTLLLTTILTTAIIFIPKILSNWYIRREIPDVIDECEEETEESHYASRTSHSSQEQYVQTDREERLILLSDASTQALDWQSFFE
jgi:hypothetical protein